MYEIILPNDVKLLLGMLQAYGFKSFVVGGAVRDMLMGNPVKDYDIATNALPEQVQNICFKYKNIPTGLKHGTVTILVNNVGYEITTFRTDGEYADNRHPTNVTFVDDILRDLSRRDFTINAMAYNDNAGLIDPFHGKEDIENKIIRCVGNPDDRFKEDALRMMRAVRFTAQLGFDMDNSTWVSICENAENIEMVSKERIRDELNKILLSNNPEYFEYLWRTDLLDCIIPELDDCFGFIQNNPHHYADVGTHTMDSVKYIEKDLVLRLAMLLHDIGKVKTKTTDATGVDHFLGHSKISELMAKEILERLKYDNDTIENVVTLVSHHMDEIVPTKSVIKRMLNKLGNNVFRNLVKVKLADSKARSNVDYVQIEKKILQSVQIADQILAEKECFSMKDLAINGNDLRDIGFVEGKILGNTLKLLLEDVLENPEHNTIEYLLSSSTEKLKEYKNV